MRLVPLGTNRMGPLNSLSCNMKKQRKKVLSPRKNVLCKRRKQQLNSSTEYSCRIYLIPGATQVYVFMTTLWNDFSVQPNCVKQLFSCCHYTIRYVVLLCWLEYIFRFIFAFVFVGNHLHRVANWILCLYCKYSWMILVTLIVCSPCNEFFYVSHCTECEDQSSKLTLFSEPKQQNCNFS